MNKRGVISEIENMPYVSITQMGKMKFIELIQKIDEPEKVKIPQFLANWIESYKHAHLSLSYAMSNISPEIRQWMDGDCVTKAEIFARAWLDGYEIEKQKYVVTDGNHLYFKKISRRHRNCHTSRRAARYDGIY